MGAVDLFRAAVRAALGMPIDPGAPPDLMRLGLYPARVDSCGQDGAAMDVTPEDSRIPPAKNVPVRVGVPGSVAIVQPGALVLIGWEGGDPQRPYIEPSWKPGATVTKLVVNAQQVMIGGDNLVPATDGVVLASGIDPLTGSTYGSLNSASTMVMAKKA